MLSLHSLVAVTVPCPLCGDMMSELDELIKHMLRHKELYVLFGTETLMTDDISTSSSDTASISKPAEDVPRIRIHKGPSTPLADRAAAYQALTRPTVPRTGPLVRPSHFKDPDTESSAPSPSFQFSLPDKIKVPEFRGNSSGTTQIASSNSPSDPESSSHNNKVPVLFRFSSPSTFTTSP